MCLCTWYGIHPHFNYMHHFIRCISDFQRIFCTILHPDESVIAKVTHSNGLYHLSANVVETINNDQYTLYVNATWRPLSLYELYCHLGHIHYRAIIDAIWNGDETCSFGTAIDPSVFACLLLCWSTTVTHPANMTSHVSLCDHLHMTHHLCLKLTLIMLVSNFVTLETANHFSLWENLIVKWED